MYKKNSAIVDFYRNGGVEKIIEKYPFSEEEKEILYRAARTAKRDEPNVELIKRADNLLSVVTKIRKPLIEESIDPKEIADVMLFAEHIEKKSREMEENSGYKKKIVRIVTFLSMMLLGYLLNYILKPLF